MARLAPFDTGWAWLAAWMAVWTSGAGAALLLFMILGGNPGPFGGLALLALFVSGIGVTLVAVATAIWMIGGLPGPRRWLALLAAAGSVAALFVAKAVDGRAHGSGSNAWQIVVAGVTLLVLAAVLAARPSERRPTLVFGALWIVLLGTLTYHYMTKTDVEVVWLGSRESGGSGAAVAFSATRSGNYEIRYQTRSCWDGPVLASGRYDWRPDISGSSFGQAEWVDLPAPILPLRSGDVIRVCLRDGLAAGTAAGESAGPPSFWPRD